MGKTFGTINGIHLLLQVALLVILSVMSSHAATGKKKLLLFAKNPVTWDIVKGGAGGKMVYHEASGAFSLTATGLNPKATYAVVRVDEGKKTATALARGNSDTKGRLKLNGVWHDWTKKFWVVPGDDVTGRIGEAVTLNAWHPEQYLFEEKPLGIVCACPEPEEP
jgi:hypothetical protein